jgi:AraC family transcriptional regulator of adaptative response/methylated-DNA-[protein]-cysteine methyltransferase
MEGKTKSNGKPTIKYRILSTPIGAMAGGASEKGIHFLEFLTEDKDRQLKNLENDLNVTLEEGSGPFLDKLELQLKEYFEGTLRSFDIPLVLTGTSFQKRVWEELLKIAFGRTVSYKEQSLRMTGIRSVRAVASANGKNRIAIVVPCHRVISSKGKLTGYAGGLWRKKWLLDHEKSFLGEQIRFL